MKGLILKDLLNLRKNFKTLFIIFFFYAIFFSAFDPSFLSGILSLMFTMQVITTFSYDDYSKWDIYALSLPITKKQLVLSKYILSLSFVLFGGVLSFLLATVVSLYKGTFVFEELISSNIGFIAVMSYFILIMLPLIFKYGVERSRIMLLAIFAIPTLLILIIGKVLNLAQIPFPSEEQLNALLPIISIIAVIVLIVGTYISYVTSVKIVTKKEY